MGFLNRLKIRKKQMSQAFEKALEALVYKRPEQKLKLRYYSIFGVMGQIALLNNFKAGL